MNAIIAVNPQQMQEAQATTKAWIDVKLQAAEAAVDEADTVLDLLIKRRMNTSAAKSILNRSVKVARYYEKVKAALAAGYYIIPPFPIQLFAIRTDRINVAPRRGERSYTLASDEAPPPSLAVGLGRYVNPSVGRVHVDNEQRPTSDPDKTRTVAIYENSDWRDELDMPVRALKPQILTEVGRALELKIFDALGIAPAYRAADPIIAGQIIDLKGKPLTFFVAWWLDESDL